MKEATARQLKVFEFIRDFIRSKEMAPTTREIGEGMGIASPFGVRRHLEALEKKGYIEREARKARGLRIADRYKEMEGLPLVGKVAAGTPVAAIENIEGYYSLGSIFGNPQMLFLLRVKGESMTGAGINDGDLAVVWKQPRVEDGEIGVAVIDDEATVKRIYRDGDKLRLVPENPAFKTIECDLSENDFRIAGKVIGVIRKI